MDTRSGIVAAPGRAHNEAARPASASTTRGLLETEPAPATDTLMVRASASTERGSNNVKRSKQTARTGARAVGGGAAGASGVAEAGAAARPHAAARAAPPAPRSSSRKRCRCMPWIFPCRQRMVDARPGSEAMHFCRPRAIVPGGARLGQPALLSRGRPRRQLVRRGSSAPRRADHRGAQNRSIRGRAGAQPTTRQTPPSAHKVRRIQ